MQLIFDQSKPGRRGVQLDALDVPEAELPPELCRAAPAELPELSELDVVRHFTRLSQRNFGVDSHCYPLGSCTMKYNPKMAEAVAANPAWTGLHPHLATAPVYREACQGALGLIHELERLLAEIAGMAAVSTQPLAGAHGELTGALLIAAYHRAAGHAHKDTILVPDSAHGTNPASATMAGFNVVEVASTERGATDLEALEAALGDNTAAIMLTCPNTHGLFESEIKRIAEMAHARDALLYYDGANLNAILGVCRPGDLGFDVMHFNLHKTFGTPHGMGGPGSGPVGVGPRLVEFLPGPRVVREKHGYGLDTPPQSIGAIAPFFGNFLVAVKAYAYILECGDDGLRAVSEHAVLNANYVLARLREAYQAPFEGPCMHECVLSAAPQTAHEVHAVDVAKALLDRGFHAPTVYFPLTVKECMMIEPTETESKETLDAFCDALLEIAALAESDPEALRTAPHNLPVGRLDEVKAAKDLDCAALP